MWGHIPHPHQELLLQTANIPPRPWCLISLQHNRHNLLSLEPELLNVTVVTVLNPLPHLLFCQLSPAAQSTTILRQIIGVCSNPLCKGSSSLLVAHILSKPRKQHHQRKLLVFLSQRPHHPLLEDVWNLCFSKGRKPLVRLDCIVQPFCHKCHLYIDCIGCHRVVFRKRSK